MLEVEGQLPVGLQLFGMQQHPCLDQFALLAREVSLEQIAIEGEGRFMSLVSGVDVRRNMVVRVHGDDDSEEHADDRPARLLAFVVFHSRIFFF